MATQGDFQQRFRATKTVSDDEHSTSSRAGEDTDLHLDSVRDSETLSDSEATSSGEDVKTVSFGALAKAQESLSKYEHDQGGFRLMSVNPPDDCGNTEAMERKAGKNDHREHFRSSKHAPAEISSKKAVSRKREVVPTVKRHVRDPRFEPVSGPLDEEKAKKNYSFLNDYRHSEMLDLKTQIRQTKDINAKEKLKRALWSMESRKRAQQMKDQEQEIHKTHRAKEKELVKQGKKPFYLKKGDQKKLALLHRFEGIKGKRLDKVIERRRKKNAQKERRDMPEERRAVNG
ncbi:MAG: hypothetical protein L6R40_001730 [Gallowayella cf. fulva]|nr:MAG: hypothetical protein L6R40_001730 [Xanthomendoza cf. fulva]